MVADKRPNLIKLLNFPGKNGNINIPEQIGTMYFKFGVLLLNDETGAEVREGKGKPLSWNTLIDILEKIGQKTLAGDIQAQEDLC